MTRISGRIEQSHFVRVIAMPDVREQLTAFGFEPIGSTPKEFAARIKWEIEKWAKVIRAADIKAP